MTSSLKSYLLSWRMAASYTHTINAVGKALKQGAVTRRLSIASGFNDSTSHDSMLALILFRLLADLLGINSTRPRQVTEPDRGE